MFFHLISVVCLPKNQQAHFQLYDFFVHPASFGLRFKSLVGFVKALSHVGLAAAPARPARPSSAIASHTKSMSSGRRSVEQGRFSTVFS
jgi:hypothetical protein